MVCNLKLPVGIDSFEKIRKNEFYYIDKTKLIEQLVETGGEVTLFTRPRRFGKTLNMSMLKAFLETGADVSLFEGLYIAENKALCDEYMGKYPVIFLSLKSVEGLNFEAAKYRITELIGREAQRFDFLLERQYETLAEYLVYALTVIYGDSHTKTKTLTQFSNAVVNDFEVIGIAKSRDTSCGKHTGNKINIGCS